MDHYIEEWCSYNFAAGCFHTNKLCSRLLLTEVEFYWQNSKNRVLCHPLGDLGVTYTVHLWLIRKHLVDFLLVLIELFLLAVMVEALWAVIGWNCGVRKGWVTLSANFRGRNVIQQSRDVVCMILHLAVLIQCRRVTDTHTDRQTHDDG